MNRKIIGLLLH